LKRFEDIPKNYGKLSFSEVANEYGVDVNVGSFTPGRFYSLKIEPTSPDLNEGIVLELNNGRPYYDVNPTGLVLYHERWQETTLILNLRVIPPRIADGLLHGYYNFASKNGLENLYNNKIEKPTNENKLKVARRYQEIKPLNERLMINQRFYMVTASALADMLRIHTLDYAINKYNTDSIREAKLIDWDNFGMLVNPRISPKGFFPTPFNIMRVYEEFIEKSLE